MTTRRFLSEEEKKKIITGKKLGYTQIVLANILGIKRVTIAQFLHRNGIGKTKYSKPPEWLKKAKQLRNKGMTWQEVADTVGVTRHQLFTIRKIHKI